jgi:hypothetical protein
MTMRDDRFRLWVLHEHGWPAAHRRSSAAAAEAREQCSQKRSPFSVFREPRFPRGFPHAPARGSGGGPALTPDARGPP